MNIFSFFSIKGVAKKKEWWGCMVCGAAVTGMAELTGDDNIKMALFAAYLLLTIPVTVRRLRDAGGYVWAPAWWVVVGAGMVSGIDILCSISGVAGLLLGLYIFCEAGFENSVIARPEQRK